MAGVLIVDGIKDYMLILSGYFLYVDANLDGYIMIIKFLNIVITNEPIMWVS
jgi:hypothetical protein